jgi:flagellar protein FlgJ
LIAEIANTDLIKAKAVDLANKTDSVVVSKVLDNDFAEVSEVQARHSGWQSPEQFVADIWPQAQKVASALGVSPALLVAQSALETGWGKHTMKFEDGRNSYNLFGIKAGADWKGAVLNRSSLEYRNGVLHNEFAQFRAYASPADSLADYVNFIHSSPRYRHALEQAGNDQAYIREIQNAGYATDPQYASKVIGILEGEVLQNSLQTLDLGASNA